VTDDEPQPAVTDDEPLRAVMGNQPPQTATNHRPPGTVTDDQAPETVRDHRPPGTVTDDQAPETVRDHQPSRGGRSYQTALLIVAMAAAGFNLRIAVSNLPPLFPDLATRLHLSTAALSLLGATPVLFFGIASAFAAWLNRRHGEERVLLVALAVLAAGLVLRGVAPGALLFPGTALAAAAIAILNVLLASMAKRRWPERAGFLIGIYLTALCVGAILASLLAVPLYHASGDSFGLTLGVWAAPAVLAMLLWLPQLRYAGPSAAPSSATPATPRIAVQRRALAWQVTVFMGLQSLLYYAALSWIPTIFQDRGTSAVTAGNLLALMGVGNLLAAPITPVLAHRTPGQRALVVPCMAAMAVGLAGCVWAPLGTAPLWVLVLGLSQGSCLGLAIYFMMARAPDSGTAASLSAFAQSGGYLMASVGPLELGLLHTATGGWDIPVVILLILAAAGVGVGVLAARPIVLSVGPTSADDQQAPTQMRHTRRLPGFAHGPSPVCRRKLLPRSRQARTAREEQPSDPAGVH
jgi:MFS transporter, CP family, cyanate transporter